jgi:hypothetical protein
MSKIQLEFIFCYIADLKKNKATSGVILSDGSSAKHPHPIVSTGAMTFLRYSFIALYTLSQPTGGFDDSSPNPFPNLFINFFDDKSPDGFVEDSSVSIIICLRVVLRITALFNEEDLLGSFVSVGSVFGLKYLEVVSVKFGDTALVVAVKTLVLNWLLVFGIFIKFNL